MVSTANQVSLLLIERTDQLVGHYAKTTLYSRQMTFDIVSYTKNVLVLYVVFLYELYIGLPISFFLPS